MEPKDISAVLESCEIFKGLAKEEIARVADLCRVRTYQAADSVYQQGDFGEYLYIIAEGQVILERSVNLGGRTGKVVIATLGRGRVFGCWSTLLDASHVMMLTPICQTPSTIFELKGVDLRKRMVGDPKLGFAIMERLCFLLRDRIQAAYGAMEKI